MRVLQPTPGLSSAMRRRFGVVLFCAVAVAASACSGDSGDEAAAETTPPTTEAGETTEQTGETIEVPVVLLDTAIPPTEFTCKTAKNRFDVLFVNQLGETSVHEARTESDYKNPTVNATCTNVVEAGDGEPAVLYEAVLDVPEALRYDSIELRYLMDDFGSVYTQLPREIAEGGLYIEMSDDDGIRPTLPEQIEALELEQASSEG